MPKNVQIPENLLYDLFSYFLRGETDEFITEDITAALNAKLDAMIKHELYTQSKTAATEEEREAARQAYLDRVGMHQSYRWSAGYKPEEPPNV